MRTVPGLLIIVLVAFLHKTPAVAEAAGRVVSAVSPDHDVRAETPLVIADCDNTTFTPPPAADVGDPKHDLSPLVRNRFYVTGIVGGSFATLMDPDQDPPALDTQSLFTAGGAVGVAMPMPFGGLRIEFEAIGREQMGRTLSVPGVGFAALTAADGWSTMANMWRDITITDNFNVYLGAGIGAGGYRLTVDADYVGASEFGTSGVSSFAWQAGGGLAYAISDRVTLDLGYRFFALNPGSTGVVYDDGIITEAFTQRSEFSASELFLSIRIYEPLRPWR
jgi:opacity protein-like surface antigen